MPAGASMPSQLGYSTSTPCSMVVRSSGIIFERSGFIAAMARIAAIEHPNILPTYVSAPIADNYLFVTPRMGVTLLEAIAKHNLTPRARTKGETPAPRRPDGMG